MSEDEILLRLERLEGENRILKERFTKLRRSIEAYAQNNNNFVKELIMRLNDLKTEHSKIWDQLAPLFRDYRIREERVLLRLLKYAGKDQEFPM